MFKKLNQFKELKKVYNTLTQETVEATGASGKIKINMNGAFQITNVTVDPSLLAPEQQATVEKGIKEAMTQAVQEIFKKLADKKDTFANLAGGMDLSE